MWDQPTSRSCIGSDIHSGEAQGYGPLCAKKLTFLLAHEIVRTNGVAEIGPAMFAPVPAEPATFTDDPVEYLGNHLTSRALSEACDR